MMDITIAIVLVFLCGLAPPSVQSQRSPVCAGVPNGGRVRSSRSCGAYVRCVNGRPFEMACPGDLLFNVRSSQCDHGARVDCGECSRYGVQNLADPSGSCRRYVRCVRGFSELRRCPSGLAFDGRVGDCNHASDVACVSEPGHDDVESVCTQFEKSDVVKVGDPEDCRRYLICSNGAEQLQYCPVNLYYNPKQGVCEAFPVNCQRPDSPLIVAPRPGSQSQHPPQPTVEPPMEPPAPTANDPDCRLYSAMGLVFVNDVNDCHRYFTCFHGIMHDHACKAHTFYNPYTTKCESTCRGVPYQVVRRADGSANEAPGSTPPELPPQPTLDPRCKKPDGNFLLDTCFSYVHCEDGRVLYDSVCVQKTYFSEADGRCVMDDDGVCPQNSGEKPVPDAPPPAIDSRCPSAIDKFAAVPNSCTDYYVCHEGRMLVQLSCAPDTFFHTLNGPCRTDVPAGCGLSSVDERCAVRATGNNLVVGSCSDYVYCIDGRVRSTYKCASDEFFDASKSICSGVGVPERCQPTVDPRCVNTPTGNIAKPNSCTDYIVCRNGVVTAEQSCLTGQYYDGTMRKCSSQPPRGCEPVADVRCGSVSIGYSAVSGSCNKYVYCVAAQVRSELECPSGQFFDEHLSGCSATRPASCPVVVVERCKRATGYFREAGSCTRYVYCIKRTVRFEYECEGGQIFSELDSKCVVGNPTNCD